MVVVYGKILNVKKNLSGCENQTNLTNTQKAVKKESSQTRNQTNKIHSPAKQPD